MKGAPVTEKSRKKPESRNPAMDMNENPMKDGLSRQIYRYVLGVQIFSREPHVFYSDVFIICFYLSTTRIQQNPTPRNNYPVTIIL